MVGTVAPIMPKVVLSVRHSHSCAWFTHSRENGGTPPTVALVYRLIFFLDYAASLPKNVGMPYLCFAIYFLTRLRLRYGRGVTGKRDWRFSWRSVARTIQLRIQMEIITAQKLKRPHRDRGATRE